MYTARQPIFNRFNRVVAYELLFRDSSENRFPMHVAQDVATSRLLVNSFLTMDIDDITHRKAALVNFPYEMLLKYGNGMIPSDRLWLEILETVKPNDETFEIIRKLFHDGHKLALDDFIYTPEWDRFMPFVRMIKFDIQSDSMENIEKALRHIHKLRDDQKRKRIRVLAEKVETLEEYEKTRALGFDYFQGWYFAKPEIIESSDIENNTAMLVAISQEVMRPNFSYDKITRLFEQDPPLSHRLLRYLNAPAFGRQVDIKSIRQAVAYLGEIQLRRFVALLVTAELGSSTQPELTRVAMVRSRMCELIAQSYLTSEQAETAFLAGLLSTLDVLLNTSMSEVVKRIPLQHDLQRALTEREGTLGGCLAITEKLERGLFDEAEAIAEALGFDATNLSQAYQQAMTWELAQQHALAG
ncbi:EAL and HDOD domain-containing protein [Echinimonas agarilytica]|uniref:HDOD domain-containing protein n=1 Tax=Echinimonas agarilytica TaxID=1215918 RepID=A0AA41W6F3_9GAMM|nr:HDOD domain-containing protein [Echinimonas agarilytica]